MLGEPKNHGELVVTLRSGEGMYHSGHALIAIVCLPGPRREDPILKEERLIPGKTLLEEVSLPGLVLSTETILMEDCVELLLCL